MKRDLIKIMCVGVLAPLVFAQSPMKAQDANWPQWRGPVATGVAPHSRPPIGWSESKNIRWKIAIPGHGHASPIVWNDRVYIQTAVKTSQKGEPTESVEEPPPPPNGPGRPGRGRHNQAEPSHIYEFILLAIERQTGQIAWQRTLCEALPHEGGHQDASQASNSPVTDGEHIIAYFGSRGLYCLDMQGQLIWRKDLGQMQTRRGFGEGSSPALFGDTVVVNWDHEEQSFIVAFDKRTGARRWKHDRDEPTSWTTPLIVTVEGRPQVVVSGINRIRGYQLDTGELLWECGGMTLNVVPTPVCDKSLVYCTSGFRGSALLAIRYANAKGDITGSDAVAWTYEGKGTPYVPSPLLYDDALYFLQENRAVLSCVDARTGRAHYTKQRLEGLRDVYASLVGANGHVYIVDRAGQTAVIQHAPEFKLLATNTLDDSFNASPAIVGNEIYLRGNQHLYCIAAD